MKLVHALVLSTALAFSGAAFANHHEGKGHGEHFKKADTNGDGAISKDEFQAESAKRFEAIDANKDGKVTQDEMKAHYEKMKEKFKERREERKAAAEPAAK